MAAKCEKDKRSLDHELRLVADPDAKELWRSKVAAADERLADAKRSLARKKEQAELFGVGAGGGAAGGGGGGGGAASRPGYVGPTNDELLDKTEKVHDDIELHLRNALNVVNDTDELADATLETLGRQREQIENVHKTVLSIDEALTRSDALLRTFGKRMMTDKIMQVFFALNLLAVVGVVVYMAVSKSGLTSDDGAADDATPGSDDVVAGRRQMLRW